MPQLRTTADTSKAGAVDSLYCHKVVHAGCLLCEATLGPGMLHDIVLYRSETGGIQSTVSSSSAGILRDFTK